MMRIFALLGFLVLSIQIAFANAAIILIAPSAAGPDVRSETYSHPLWITWPAPADSSAINQLISIVTRRDDIPIQDRDFVFRTGAMGQYTNIAPLNRFGLPNPMEVSNSIAALSLASSGMDKGVLAMASCSNSSTWVRSAIDPKKEDLIYCARATNWDDVAKVSRQITGETMVVEFPPLAGHRYSRVWQFQHGKPAVQPPVGIIRSHTLLDFVSPASGEGTELVLDPGHSTRSGSPDRWLAVGELAATFRVGLFVLGWVAVLVSLGFLSQEVSRVGSRVACYVFLGLYFACRFFPAFVVWSGIGLWWFWLLALTALVIAVFIGVDLTVKDSSNPLVAVGLPLTILANLIPPSMSPFGPLYSLSAGGAQVDLAFNLIFGVYCFQDQYRRSGVLWFASMTLMPLLAVIAFLLGVKSSALLVLVFLYQFRVKWVRVLAVAANILASLFMAVSPDGREGQRYAGLHPRDAPNYFELVRQVVHPEFAVLLFGMLIAVVFASRFESDQLRRTWRDSLTVKPLFVVSLFVLLWTVGDPPLLGVLPWMLTLAYLFWSQETLRFL